MKYEMVTKRAKERKEKNVYMANRTKYLDNLHQKILLKSDTAKTEKPCVKCWLAGCAHGICRSRWKLRDLLLYGGNMLFAATDSKIVSGNKKYSLRWHREWGQHSNGREGEFSQRENCNENANSVHERKRIATEKERKNSGSELKCTSDANNCGIQHSRREKKEHGEKWNRATTTTTPTTVATQWMKCH